MKILKQAQYDGKFIRATRVVGIIETTTGFWISHTLGWPGWYGPFVTFLDAYGYHKILNKVTIAEKSIIEVDEVDTLPSETEWSMDKPYLEIPFDGSGGDGGGGGATASWESSDD